MKLLPVGTRVRFLYIENEDPEYIKIGSTGIIVKSDENIIYRTKDGTTGYHEGWSPYHIQIDGIEYSDADYGILDNIDQVASIENIVSVFRNRFLELE